MSDTVIGRDAAGFDPRRGRWIPWAFVGAFLVVVAVNATLIYAAVSTFTGVTTGHSYDRGRAYNAVLEEGARQDAIGWTARVSLEEKVLTVTVADRAGQAVGGRVEGVLLRPLEGAELALDFAAAGPGRFIALADLPAKGQWEARLAVTSQTGQRFDIRQRMVVR